MGRSANFDTKSDCRKQALYRMSNRNKKHTDWWYLIGLGREMLRGRRRKRNSFTNDPCSRIVPELEATLQDLYTTCLIPQGKVMCTYLLRAILKLTLISISSNKYLLHCVLCLPRTTQLTFCDPIFWMTFLITVFINWSTTHCKKHTVR